MNLATRKFSARALRALAQLPDAYLVERAPGARRENSNFSARATLAHYNFGIFASKDPYYRTSKTVVSEQIHRLQTSNKCQFEESYDRYILSHGLRGPLLTVLQ